MSGVLIAGVVEFLESHGFDFTIDGDRNVCVAFPESVSPYLLAESLREHRIAIGNFLWMRHQDSGAAPLLKIFRTVPVEAEA